MVMGCDKELDKASAVEFVRDFVARNTFVTGYPDKDCETSRRWP